MRRAIDIEELVSDPFGRYLVGPTSISFVIDASLAGVVVFGRPEGDDVRAMVRTHERLRPILPPHDAYVDVRRLELAETGAFAALGEFIASRGAWLGEMVQRMVLVRSTGLLGALTAGFFDVSPAPLPVTVFTDPTEALTFLGRGEATAICRTLDTIVTDATDTPELLRALRSRLDARPGSLSLKEAASLLAVSERSLQRRLASCGTSYQAERNQSQVRAAKRLLRDTDAPLTNIAIDVGCASLSHFSALFRKLEGVSPSEFRAGDRADDVAPGVTSPAARRGALEKRSG